MSLVWLPGNSAAPPTGVVLGLPADPVLVVVGCAAVAPAIRQTLTSIEGATWYAVADSREAFGRIAETPPDLVFVDADDARALELCRVLKSQVMTATIALVAVGGGEAGREGAVHAGCDHWVPSAFSDDELRSRCLHLLRTRGLFRALVDTYDEERRRREWVRYLVHDLRNGLSSILSNFEYVAETVAERTEEADAALKEASFSARRMAALLQDMLDVDRFRRRELRPRPSRFDLGQSLAQAAADVRLIARARGTAVQLAAPSCEVEADRSLIERVLANLVGNAVRYARTVIRVSVDVDDERVRISVANDGPAIPADARDRIFVPFMQLDGGHGGGAGLGLAFCRLALEAHGGSIKVGDGSDVAFVVTLPRRPPAT